MFTKTERLISLRNDVAPADLDFIKSRSSSYGSYAATQDDDVIMSIASYIDTGSAYSYRGSYKSIFDTANGGVHYTWSTGTGIEEKVRFTSDGKVGIGTNNPEVKLEVYNGALQIRNLASSDAAKIILRDDSGSYNHYQIRNLDGNFYIRNSGANPQFNVISALNTGNVGINQAVPAVSLHLKTHWIYKILSNLFQWIIS